MTTLNLYPKRAEREGDPQIAKTIVDCGDQKNTPEANRGNVKKNQENDTTKTEDLTAVEIAEQNSGFLAITDKGGYRNNINVKGFKDGLYLYKLNSENDFSVKPIWVSDPIEIIDTFCALDGKGNGITIGFKGKLGYIKYPVMSKQLIKPTDLLADLLDRGLRYKTGGYPANTILIDFLKEVQSKNFKIKSDKAGWINSQGERGFVLPGQSIGFEKIRIEYEASGEEDYLGYLYPQGRLSGWQYGVSIPLGSASSRVVLSICQALTCVLLSEIPINAAGLHYVGKSSKGKSTALKAARSTVGLGVEDQDLTDWNQTPMGIELLANAHNNLPLILDEIGSSQNKKAILPSVYSVMSGKGKGTGKSNREGRKINKFNSLPQSSGEKTLEEIAKETKMDLPAGVLVRMLQIDADAGAGLGVYEKNPVIPTSNPDQNKEIDLKSITGALELDKYLKTQLRANFGTALPAFIKCWVKLTKDGRKKELEEYINKERTEFVNSVVSKKDTSTQIKRMANAIGFIFAVGLLASGGGGFITRELLGELGYEGVSNITGWNEELVKESLKKCFNDCKRLNFTGGRDREIDDLINRVNLFIETNLTDFMPREDRSTSGHYHNSKGWLEQTNTGECFVYLTPETFRQYITANEEDKKQLVIAGILVPDQNNNKMYRQERLWVESFQKKQSIKVYKLRWKNAVKDISETDKNTEPETDTQKPTGEFSA